MSRRWATTALFFVNGAVIGTFVAQIPWIQERFDLSKSEMGLVLIGMSVAVILAFPVAGQLIVKHGSARMTWLGGLADALAVNLVILAPRPLLVPLALFVLGASNATMDVSMNAHGVKVEKRPRAADHVLAARRLVVRRRVRRRLRGRARGARRRPADHRRAGVRAAARGRRLATPRIGEGSDAEGEDAPRFTAPSRACCCSRSCACW